MRIPSLIFAAVLFVAACGDNGLSPIDAPVDVAGISQCSDGIDNDGDGKTDYPADPGCTAPNQDDEVDDCPSGPNCSQCANGVDDDGNGSIDYPGDPGCTSASDPFEFVNNPIACGGGLVITPLPSNGMASGTLDAASTSSIASTCGGGAGAAAVAYQISLAAPKVLVATTAGSMLDTVLDLRGSNCAMAEIACNDDASSTDSTSTLTRSLPAGNYYLIVEGHDSTETGAYTLEVTLFTGEGEGCSTTAQCGPGLVCRTPLGGTTGMKCSKPMCSDMVDDDGDGKNDYPTDPGCDSPTDNDETDSCPSGADCPACSNGRDDDGDTLTDYPLDPSCSSAAGNSEACTGEQDPISALVAATTSGTLVGSHDNHDPRCGSDGGGDVLYTLALPAMRTLVIDTEATVADTVLSLLPTTCNEPSLACDDDGGTSTGASRLALANLAASTYILAVDNFNAVKPPGAYTVHITGVIAPGGSCNPADTLGGALTCPATNPCTGVTGAMRCMASACGDGIDNDGDLKIDFPADPGCSSLDDTDEGDSCPGVGPGCPECADGIDNDGDGQTDFPADTNCTSPSQASEGCVTTDGVEALVMPVTTGTTVGANNDLTTTCSATGTNTAPDRTYSLQLPAMRSLSIVNTNSFNQIVKLFNSTCGGTPMQCRDEPETIALNNLAAGLYFYVVDGYSTGTGAYTVTVSGTIQNAGSCELPLALNGAITCGAGFACRGTPGTRTCQAAACGDGVDNDGDGIADYPNDPGCASVSDNDETDTCPGGAGCPACSDGLDNDGDLLIDYPNDPSCLAASGTTEVCSSSEGVTPLVMAMTPDTTAGAVNDESPTCSSVVNTAPDKLYSLTVPTLTSLSIVNANSFDAVVSLLDSTCGGTPVACSDTPEDLTLGALAAGTYYYVVDGSGSTPGAAYTINVSGRIASGQSCEGVLATSGALSCADGFACKGASGMRTCQVAACGDGMDNDGDTHADYPFDPGCSSRSDDDETDPAIAPVCSNAADDDTDLATDFPADYGCSSAAATSEAFCVGEVDPSSVITSTPVTGTTTGRGNNFTSSTCQSDASGPDVAYGLQLPVPVATLVLDLSTSGFDTVLTLRDTQCATQLGCDDDSGDPGAQSKLTMTNVPAGGYAVVIDGYDSGSGVYSLAVRGTVAPGTSCTSPLFTTGVLVCPSSTTCTGTPAKCQ